MIVFIDTNIWIYAVDKGEPQKQAAALAYILQTEQAHTIALSPQVMQEFFNATTCKKEKLLKPDMALKHLAAMADFKVMESNAHSVMAATELMREHKLSWWDSLILEAALRAKADVLASEDGQAGRKFGKLIVENPFIA
jgi:predicted nucleic acid-binding protein